MKETNACRSNFGVPEYMKNVKTKVVKVDLPGFHRFQQRVFHNYCLVIMFFDKGEIQYFPWESIFDIISQMSPIRKMDNEDFDEATLADIWGNSEQLGNDIESSDLSEMANIFDLSF